MKATAKTDVLFHMSSIVGGLNILKSDYLKLKLPNTVEVRAMGRGDFYWASFARTRTSAFFVNKGNTSLVFTLDGRKLGQRMRSVPVDYWSNLRRGHESEERLLLDKPTLPKFHTYVTALTFIGNDEQVQKFGKTALAYASKQGFPAPTFYATYTDWLKRKPKDVTDLLAGAPDEELELNPEYTIDAQAEKEFLSQLQAYLFDWEKGEGQRPAYAGDKIEYVTENVNGYGTQAAQALVMSAFKKYKVHSGKALNDFVSKQWDKVEAYTSAKQRLDYAEKQAADLKAIVKTIAENSEDDGVNTRYLDMYADRFDNAVEASEHLKIPLGPHLRDLQQKANGNFYSYLSDLVWQVLYKAKEIESHREFAKDMHLIADQYIGWLREPAPTFEAWFEAWEEIEPHITPMLRDGNTHTVDALRDLTRSKVHDVPWAMLYRFLKTPTEHTGQAIYSVLTEQ